MDSAMSRAPSTLQSSLLAARLAASGVAAMLGTEAVLLRCCGAAIHLTFLLAHHSAVEDAHTTLHNLPPTTLRTADPLHSMLATQAPFTRWRLAVRIAALRLLLLLLFRLRPVRPRHRRAGARLKALPLLRLGRHDAGHLLPLLALGRHERRYAATKHHQAVSRYDPLPLTLHAAPALPGLRLGANEECWENARCRSEGQRSLIIYVDWSFGYHVYMLITITISLAALAPQTHWPA